MPYSNDSEAYGLLNIIAARCAKAMEVEGNKLPPYAEVQWVACAFDGQGPQAERIVNFATALAARNNMPLARLKRAAHSWYMDMTNDGEVFADL